MAGRAAALARHHSETFHWNTIIAEAATQNPQNALSAYKSMLALSVPPNHLTYPPLLKSFSALRFRPDHIHSHLLRRGLIPSDAFSAASLISAYGKSGCTSSASRLFDEIPRRTLDAACWTSIVRAFSVNGRINEALSSFGRMRRSSDVEPDVVTIATVLSAVSEDCRALHALASKIGFEHDTRLANTLVHAYSTCASVDDALAVFDGIAIGRRDVVSWNTMISGLAVNGRPERALSVFEDLVMADVEPSHVTLIAILKCCAQIGCADTCRRVCNYAVSLSPMMRWSEDDNVIIATAMLDAQARCGDVESARRTFDAVPKKNVFCWSAMIAGYEKNSRPDEALRLFKRMLSEGDVRPNDVTALSAIASCSALGAHRPARAFHKYVLVASLDVEAPVASALIDMYAKCGDMGSARQVFAGIDGSNAKTIAIWTAIIAAEGLHGEGRQALRLFSEMRDTGLKPNDVTFIGLLSACSHSGLIEEGRLCFNAMERDHGISPNAKHYGCMVDLLSRAGHIEEAYRLVNQMPFEADAAIWGSLLAACRVHGNHGLAEVIEKRIVGLGSWSVGYQLLLANMYGETGRLSDAGRMRVELRKSGKKKIPGQSFVEIHGG
ncbi:Pentatricopeptide repeat-containing protein [Acorus gramineus]|uniref:Pentatricopeptide repeat-containing protein n=1 Tax=Acorus gramineus TaxID=55184 RepID=A0AAV9ABI2_ACOGR|nr:Pentatricopeptide repeat-containing protein [Acorus gramineus]